MTEDAMWIRKLLYNSCKTTQQTHKRPTTRRGAYKKALFLMFQKGNDSTQGELINEKIVKKKDSNVWRNWSDNKLCMIQHRQREEDKQTLGDMKVV